MVRQPIVLAIDDDREMLRSVKRVLQREPVKLVTFSDPRKLLSHVANKRVDVVLSDIDMPLMNGLDLLNQTKLLRPDTARIVLSGVRDMDAAVRAINDGSVHRFVRKPFASDELRATLREAIAIADGLRGAKEADELEAWTARAGSIDSELLEARRDSTGAYVLDVTAAEHVAPELGLEHLLRIYAP